MSSRHLRLVLNGKKADLPGIREAVDAVRKDGHKVDVRVTWEAGDASLIAAEAIDHGVDVIVACGGDGTVNEVVNGVFSVTDSPESAMAVVPLGSANDFARGCGHGVGDPTAALRIAASGEPVPIDVGRINERYFLNALVIGFGAEVTFKTSDRMKKVMGGAAYGLMGMLTALEPVTYNVKYLQDELRERKDDKTVFAAVANGRQAGGIEIAPLADLTDGRFDVINVPEFQLSELPEIRNDLMNLGKREPRIITYDQVTFLDVEVDRDLPISPDGEQLTTTKFRVDVLKQRLPFVLPHETFGRGGWLGVKQ